MKIRLQNMVCGMQQLRLTHPQSALQVSNDADASWHDAGMCSQDWTAVAADLCGAKQMWIRQHVRGYKA